MLAFYVDYYSQESYLLEVKGDVQDTLPTSMDDSGAAGTSQEDGDIRIYYMVHPSVDAESTSSFS